MALPGSIGLTLGEIDWLAEYHLLTERGDKMTEGDKRLAAQYHPLTMKFHAILEELRELHLKKNKDYGLDDDPLANVRASEDWGIPAWVGAMIRAGDKFQRLKKFAKVGKLENESVLDAFNDGAVYFIIARILYEENLPK